MTAQAKRLYDIAYARSGDKGGNANIGLIAYREEDYGLLLSHVTEERVAAHFASLGVEKVIKYPLPNLLAVNFVLIGALGKGGASSLRTDAQGKALGQALLEMEIPEASFAEISEEALVLCRNIFPAVYLVTLNRPDKRNALSIPLLEKLCHTIDTLNGDPAVRVIIINGEGPLFCAGLDLAEAADWTKAQLSAKLLARTFSALHNSPHATIAAVHGAAIAGGAGLMCACDIAIAADNARFGFPETKRGLVAAQILTFLNRQLRGRDIRELLLMGELIGSEKALSIGLINRAVAPKELLNEATSCAEKVLCGAPQATALTKQFIDTLSPTTFEEDLQKALALHEQVRESEEAREGIHAFIEKRAPSWDIRGG